MTSDPEQRAQERARQAEQIRRHLPPALDARVQSARIISGRVVIVAEAGDVATADRPALEAEFKTALAALEGVSDIRIALTGERRRIRLIAVGSGKGGVGKSTVTTNLAVALARLGRKVGVVDGDIYGPSQPKLLATEGMKPMVEGDKLVPLESRHGVKVLSIGHVVAPGKALAWRGPMTGKALSQLIDAAWGDTEILLIDLPPGTGDVQLSMISDHRPDGVVLVSTPQDLALIDAARAGQMFDQGNVPIIGLVENMAGYECPHCGEVSDPFGQGGVERFAAALDLPFLGRIPLTLNTRMSGDAGTPPAAGDGPEALPFTAIAALLDHWLDTGAI
jgi:ATP-binding protein involved in chromosome partitioning